MITRRRAASASTPDDALGPGMLGILSVMLLLVPALLLMAHVVGHAAITVRTPLYGGHAPDDGVIRCRGVELEVAITRDGYLTRTQGAWQRVGSGAAGLDHAALGALARAWKRQHPHETVAYVSAQASVSYGELVATLDTLRGRECRLGGVLAGEEAPEGCLMWQPIVLDRAPNLHVPEFLRGPAWPPQGPHTNEAGS